MGRKVIWIRWFRLPSCLRGSIVQHCTGALLRHCGTQAAERGHGWWRYGRHNWCRNVLSIYYLLCYPAANTVTVNYCRPIIVPQTPCPGHYDTWHQPRGHILDSPISFKNCNVLQCFLKGISHLTYSASQSKIQGRPRPQTCCMYILLYKTVS